MKKTTSFEYLTVLLLGVVPACSAPATPAMVPVEPPLVGNAIPQPTAVAPVTQPAAVAPVTQPIADSIDPFDSLRSDNALPLDEYRDSVRVRIRAEQDGSLVVAWGSPDAHHFDPRTRGVFVNPRAGTMSTPFFLGSTAPFDFVPSVGKQAIQVLAGHTFTEIELFKAGNKRLARWDSDQNYTEDEEGEFVAIASGGQLGLFAGREVYRLGSRPKGVRKLHGVPILGPDEILLGRPVICNNQLYVLVVTNETTLSLRSWNPSARKVAKLWRETRLGHIFDGALVCHQSEPWLLLHDKDGAWLGRVVKGKWRRLSEDLQSRFFDLSDRNDGPWQILSTGQGFTVVTARRNEVSTSSLSEEGTASDSHTIFGPLMNPELMYISALDCIVRTGASVACVVEVTWDFQTNLASTPVLLLEGAGKLQTVPSPFPPIPSDE